MTASFALVSWWKKLRKRRNYRSQQGTASFKHLLVPIHVSAAWTRKGMSCSTTVRHVIISNRTTCMLPLALRDCSSTLIHIPNIGISDQFCCLNVRTQDAAFFANEKNVINPVIQTETTSTVLPFKTYSVN